MFKKIAIPIIALMIITACGTTNNEAPVTPENNDMEQNDNLNREQNNDGNINDDNLNRDQFDRDNMNEDDLNNQEDIPMEDDVNNR